MARFGKGESPPSTHGPVPATVDQLRDLKLSGTSLRDRAELAHGAGALANAALTGLRLTEASLRGLICAAAT